MSPRAYRSPSRDATASQTRNRIVEAANALLRAPEGFAQFSLETVAKEAQVTRTTVYKHFGSRRAILEIAFDDMSTRGGLHRLGAMLGTVDAHAALHHTITIFCDFWGSDREALVRLHGAAVIDPDFEASLHERNERRRQLLERLVGELAPAKSLRPATRRDLVDVLFALTSVHMFDQLSRQGRQTGAICQLVQDLADSALQRAGLGR
jgi:AcrR family transcriptional regulator